jgi:hypothetical protein
VALALGSKRSTAAAVTSAIAAMAVAAAVAGRSCRVTQPGPEVAVRDLLQAIKTGDRDTAYVLLSPATKARLEIEAKRATDYVGAAVRFTAKDLVSLSAFEGPVPDKITVTDQRDDRATVYISSAAGGGHIDLVRVDGLWRIDLPNFAAP